MRYVLKSGAVIGLFIVVALAAPSGDAAYIGASDPTVSPPDDQARILQSTVLVLETTDTTNSIQQALTNLGVPFDLIASSDWTGIDFSPYEIVIAGMDGGMISQASIQAIRSGVVDAGKRACFVGGSAYVDFVIGLNNDIIGIDTGNYGWTVSTMPHVTVTDPNHFLAQGLPPSINFVDTGAAVFMARLTDGDMEVAAVNGDGQPCLVYKGNNFPGGGTGEFMWFVNSAYDFYWSDPGDFAIFEQVMANFLAGPVPPVLVVETSDTSESIQLALTNLGVSFDLIWSTDWAGVDFSPYDIVIAGMDGGGMEDSDLQAIRTGVIDAGKRACFVGGSAMEPFVTGVNNHIIGVDTGVWAWAASPAPHVTVTDPAHFLARALPSPTTFVNAGAAYYMARLTDPDMDIAAVNGDGYPCLVSKMSNFPGGGAGDFRWFISSAQGDYWTDPGDFAFFQEMMANLIREQPLFEDGFESGDTLAWSETVGLALPVTPATCAELWTDMDVWGDMAAGIDLRSRTNSTLHWIGCPSSGCTPAEFYCVDDPGMETLTFGTGSSNSLRALVDPGNAAGDTIPTFYSDCATAATPMDISNAPDSNCNGSGINCIDALCRALGYQGGVVLREVASNYCPEPHALNADGTDWASDFVFSDGWGAEYECSGFIN